MSFAYAKIVFSNNSNGHLPTVVINDENFLILRGGEVNMNLSKFLGV